MKEKKSGRKYTIQLIVGAAILFVLHRYLGVNLFLTLLIIAVIGAIIEVIFELSKKARRKGLKVAQKNRGELNDER